MYSMLEQDKIYPDKPEEFLKFCSRKEFELQTILDSVPAMVFYKDTENRFLKTNKAFEDAMNMPKEKLEGKSMLDIYPKDQAEAYYKDDLEVIHSGKAKRGIIESLKTFNGEKLIQTDKIPHFDENGKIIGIIGFAIDITEQRKKENELQKLNRALSALSNSNQLLIKSTDEMSYLNNVCKIIIEDCGYELVWIGYAQNDQAKSIKPIAYSGFDETYLNSLNITWADTELGQGPTGTAMRTGEICMCKDMNTDQKFSPWKQEALKRGYASSIALPMKKDGVPFGTITIYSKQVDQFSEKEITLLKELASDVSYGVSSLKTKQAHFEAAELLQKNEAKLNTERNILNTIMNNSQAGLAYIDRDFNFASVNSVFCKNNGRTEEELLGKNYFDFFPSEENRLLFEKIRSTGQQVELKEKPLVFKNQPWREITYWDWTITPVKNSDGYVYGLAISFVDVSDSVKSIENLKIHSRKLEQITSELRQVQVAVENASDIIFITDSKGKIIYINKAVKNILGYKQKELIGRKPNFWMEDMPNKFFGRMWKSIYFNKEPFIGEIKDRKKDGSIFMAEIKIAPVLDKDNQILSFVGIERDITEIKRLDQAKTEFISLAAHQLRTPITTVSLTAEMLLNGISGKMDRDMEEYLGNIIGGIKKMSEMIEIFLNVSRIEMKTFEINPKPTNILQLIEENINAVLPQIKNKNLEFKKNIPVDLPIISIDPKVINIVLENFLSNAIKYTPEKGVVGIEAEKFRDNITIKVFDSGYGIPKDEQERVFDKLFRSETTRDKIEGVGLGLYLSKSITDQAGGKIWVKSEKDKGTAFFVSFPIKETKKKL